MARVQASASGGCLVWTGGTSSRGYGMMKVEWSDGESRVLGVHRVRMMCSLRTTQFPAGYEASHLCHNKLCLSVPHMSLEQNWVNMFFLMYSTFQTHHMDSNL